jgi:hypothetical protein
MILAGNPAIKMQFGTAVLERSWLAAALHNALHKFEDVRAGLRNAHGVVFCGCDGMAEGQI